MIIDFNSLREITVPVMNNGKGKISSKMFMDNSGKIISCRIHVGASIGTHRHETSDDISFVISGNGKAICDGEEEELTEGVCHICRKGSSHSIINTGNEELVLLTVVSEK